MDAECRLGTLELTANKEFTLCSVLQEYCEVMSSFSGVSSSSFLFFSPPILYEIFDPPSPGPCAERNRAGSYVRPSERLPASQQPPESLPLPSHHLLASSRPTLNRRPLVSTRHYASVDLYCELYSAFASPGQPSPGHCISIVP